MAEWLMEKFFGPVSMVFLFVSFVGLCAAPFVGLYVWWTKPEGPPPITLQAESWVCTATTNVIRARAYWVGKIVRYRDELVTECVEYRAK